MKTAYDLVWIAGERTPDHLALVDDRTDRKLTYRQLLAEVDTVAAGLAARGIKAGSRVATILPEFFRALRRASGDAAARGRSSIDECAACNQPSLPSLSSKARSRAQSSARMNRWPRRSRAHCLRAPCC